MLGNVHEEHNEREHVITSSMKRHSSRDVACCRTMLLDAVIVENKDAFVHCRPCSRTSAWRLGVPKVFKVSTFNPITPRH